MRAVRWQIIAVTLLSACGCAVLDHPYDEDYTYSGARWVRTDATRGRVGSQFYSAGHQAMHTEEASPVPAPPAPYATPPQGGGSDASPNEAGDEGTGNEGAPTKPRREKMTDPINYRY